MAALNELNLSRVSNIMSARTSNPPCRTIACSAGEIRVKNIESVIVEGCKCIQETYLLLKSVRLLQDYCDKSALVQTLINFFLNIFNTSKYTHIHRKEGGVQLYYQRIAGMFWC